MKSFKAFLQMKEGFSYDGTPVPGGGDFRGRKSPDKRAGYYDPTAPETLTNTNKTAAQILRGELGVSPNSNGPVQSQIKQLIDQYAQTKTGTNGWEQMVKGLQEIIAHNPQLKDKIIAYWKQDPRVAANFQSS